MTAHLFLYEHLKNDFKKCFGITDEKYLIQVTNAWMNDESNSKNRYETMSIIVGDKKLRKQKILDMASGCGTFVFYGLMNGYNVYGIEPEKWKHQFTLLKAKEKGYPDTWMKRFYIGVGEHLPFKDESFDIISTYQTLEHVQSHDKCFNEFKRVLKKGGHLFIRCPDNTSFFEGHYRIPMLPLMNRSLFKFYLKIIKKPTVGIDTLNYITKKKIFKYLEDDYKIFNISSINIKTIIYNKYKINSNIIAYVHLKYWQIKNIFKHEKSVNIVAVKNV